MSLNNNETQTNDNPKDDLYGLIISQLLNDGHQEAARLIQKKEGMKKVLMPSNKLAEIYKDHLKNSTMDNCDEDEIVLKYGEEVRSEGFKKFEEGDFDREMMVSVILEQIKLVGSKKMYDKVSNFNFGEPYFLEEKEKLYDWRKKFFWENFPVGSWYTDGGDDSHYLDTVPFQITWNFDEVVAKACRSRKPPYSNMKEVYFENDEIKSFDASFAFDCNSLKSTLEDYYNVFPCPFDNYENQGEALVVLATLYQNQPFKLEYYALKKCLEFDLHHGKLPNQLKDKVSFGYYRNCEDIEEFIHPDGKKHFGKIRNYYKQIDTKDHEEIEGESD